jgi:hypothetical protein
MKPIDDTEGTAGYLGVTAKGLRNMRYRGEGPPFVKVGSLVRYRMVDVDRWLDERMVTKRGPDAAA